MIYYIFKSQIFTVFLSTAHLTAMTFSSKIYDYVGGQKGDFQIYELNKGRSLVIEPKRKDINRNFLIFLKKNKYHFNLTYSEEYSNKDIEIREARSCSLYTLLKNKPEYQLFECPKSLLVKAKGKSKLKVNGLYVDDSKFISKGPPVWINNKLVYLKGRAL